MKRKTKQWPFGPPKPTPPLPDDMIPKVLYAFYAGHPILSALGLYHRERKRLVFLFIKGMFWCSQDKVDEQLKAFLNKYLTCLKELI